MEDTACESPSKARKATVAKAERALISSSCKVPTSWGHKIYLAPQHCSLDQQGGMLGRPPTFHNHKSLNSRPPPSTPTRQ